MSEVFIQIVLIGLDRTSCRRRSGIDCISSFVVCSPTLPPTSQLPFNYPMFKVAQSPQQHNHDCPAWRSQLMLENFLICHNFNHLEKAICISLKSLHIKIFLISRLINKIRPASHHPSLKITESNKFASEKMIERVTKTQTQHRQESNMPNTNIIKKTQTNHKYD